jgi:diguanylate cyclase (GGDEF)-like protein
VHSPSASFFLFLLLFTPGAFAALDSAQLRAELEAMEQQVHRDPVAVRAFLVTAEPLIAENDTSSRLWFWLRRAQAYNGLFMYEEFERDIASALALGTRDAPVPLRLWLQAYDGLIRARAGELKRGVDILTRTAQEANQYEADRVFVFAVQELAYVRGLLEHYDESLVDLHRAYTRALESDQRDLLAMVNDAYGAVYAYMRDYPRSLEYYRLALAEFEELGYKEQTASVLLGLASTHRYAGQGQLAEEYFLRYLDFTRYAVGKHHLFYGNYGLAMTFAEQGDCQRALPQIETTLGLTGPDDYKAELFKSRATCETLAGNFPAADAALRKAARILNGIPELAGTSWVLELRKIESLIEYHRGNIERAFALSNSYYEDYIEQLEKSSSNNMNMLRADLENERKDLQIALLEQEAEVSRLHVDAQQRENQLQRYLISLFVLTSLAILVGFFIQRLNTRRVLALSHRDSLSGLYNRRFTFAYLERVIPQISVADGGLALILLDIDNFKAINDRYGHPTGDAVIKRIAAIGEQSLRNRDIMGRIGGEEFLCILPRATAAQSQQVAQRLLDAISAEEFTARDGSVFSTSISIGIANFDASVSSADQLYGMADVAMYHSKKTGKNRITAYQPQGRIAIRT